MSKKNNKQTKLTRESGMFKKEGLSLGGCVRDLRNQRGWTLEEAGLRMNMDPKHLWKLEHAYDGLNVTLVTLVRIADAFGTPVQSLFAYRGETRDPLPRKKKNSPACKGLPFEYHDAPLKDELHMYTALYDLNKAQNKSPEAHLSIDTWVYFDEESQYLSDNNRCIVRLSETLSNQVEGAKFAVIDPCIQWKSDTWALVLHPKLHEDSDYYFKKLYIAEDSKSIIVQDVDSDQSSTITLDESASLRILGYLHSTI
jgi:transcriptional regulator with XRE-family HTH domain